MTQVELNVTAGRDQAGLPLVWRLCRDFDVKLTIKRANIDETAGWALIQLEGATEEIQRATAWLMSTGTHVEASKRAVGA